MNKEPRPYNPIYEDEGHAGRFAAEERRQFEKFLVMLKREFLLSIQLTEHKEALT